MGAARADDVTADAPGIKPIVHQSGMLGGPGREPGSELKGTTKSKVFRLDLPSWSAIADEASSFVWPTNYETYLLASLATRDRIISLKKAATSDEVVRTAFGVGLSGVLIDVDRVLRAALDLHSARSSGGEVVFDRNWSPVMAALSGLETITRGDMERARMFPPRRSPRTLRQKAFAVAGLLVSCCRLALVPASRRIDFQNESPLLDEFMLARSDPVVVLRPDRWPLKTNGHIPSHISDLVDAISTAVSDVLAEHGCCRRICDRANIIIQAHVGWQLEYSYRQAVAFVDSWFARQPRGLLVGGTPKDIGRLLNWHYRHNGGQVWRFSHGGDRAFFNDPLWPITELFQVDRYHVHGSREAQNMQSRFRDYDVIDPPEFVTFGSRKHQSLWHQGERRRKIRASHGLRKKKVVVFSGSFLGEAVMGALDFRQPDPLAIDTQFSLVETLIRNAYDVFVKPHPGGLHLEKALYAALKVPTIAGQFDANVIDADCYVFEFAGSAFFDALASEVGIVLVDMGIRPWDPNGRADIEQRCEIVAALNDEHNRLRVPEADLIEAVENACATRGCPEDFARGYFWQ